MGNKEYVARKLSLSSPWLWLWKVRGQVASQAWLGSWVHQGGCWALGRLGLWGLGHNGAAGSW